MGGLRSLANPARPLCLGGIPHRPPPEGLWGTECCPFFCSICRPQPGRAGNETMAFFPGFWQGRNSDFASNRHKMLNFIKNRPVSELARSGEAWHRYKTLNFIEKTAGVRTSNKSTRPDSAPKTLNFIETTATVRTRQVWLDLTVAQKTLNFIKNRPRQTKVGIPTLLPIATKCSVFP